MSCTKYLSLNTVSGGEKACFAQSDYNESCINLLPTHTGKFRLCWSNMRENILSDGLGFIDMIMKG